MSLLKTELEIATDKTVAFTVHGPGVQGGVLATCTPELAKSTQERLLKDIQSRGIRVDDDGELYSLSGTHLGQFAYVILPEGTPINGYVEVPETPQDLLAGGFRRVQTTLQPLAQSRR